MQLKAHGATDVGRVRKHNEDSLAIDESLGLAVVADGMGGHASGEVASRITVDVVRDTIAAQRTVLSEFAGAGDAREPSALLALMREAVVRASRAVYDEAVRDPSKYGMGTTCTALLLCNDTGFLAHVGDSRAYLLRGGQVVRLTRDHSLLDMLVADGRLTRAEAESDDYAGYRNALSRAVGIDRDVNVDAASFEILPGDTLVLVSDGLTRHVDDDEIRSLLTAPGASPQRLVDLANSRGGGDNITVVVAQPVGVDAADSRRSDDFAQRLRALRRIPVFRGLSHAQTLQILCIATTVSVAEGDEIVSAEADDDALFALLEGRVRLEEDGQTTSLLGDGETFGALSVVGRTTEDTRVIATAPCRIVRLDRRDLAEILGRAPATGALLLEALQLVV